MTKRNGCKGADTARCCDPVVLPYTIEDVRRLLDGERHELGLLHLMVPENRRWVLEDLTPMRRRDGIEMVSDYMSGGGKSQAIVGGEPMVIFSHFYPCRHYDRETRQCMAYDRRPPICGGFPWYGEEPDESKAIPPECSFNVDVGRSVKFITREEAVAARGDDRDS